ncbi:AbrB family transcriptional regulator [Polycladidibacter stylochi]|uniref:AbrB family transcriptional regulator n=1 Tax=Polycladidibacter stylochi TaxID=1807766 RepID=UPI000831E45F|nr:AbrB family transcriptional regulator [Pseudovibrio stylochi]
MQLSWRLILWTASTLLIGATGYLVFDYVGAPLAVFLGPVSFLLIATRWLKQLNFPNILVSPVYLVVGAVLGQGVTDGFLAHMSKWPISLGAILLLVPAIIFITSWVLSRVFAWSHSQSFYATIPGALPMTMAMAEEKGEALAPILTVQLTRLMFMVVLVPLTTSIFIEIEPSIASSLPPMTAVEYLWLAVGCYVVGWIFARLKLPAGYLSGAILASSFLHITGVVKGGLPANLETVFLMMMGCKMGLYVKNVSQADLVKSLLPSIVAFIVASSVAFCFAVLLSYLTGFSILQLFISYTPGGQEAMILLAGYVGADPAFVVAHHLFRFIGLLVLMPFLLRWFRADDLILEKK